ncbi:hypothetical protein TNCV_2286271 [Trichonephila clavipes]|nr:hypothetical protein TNCV_2286271 [Trichonephila clavipes]
MVIKQEPTSNPAARVCHIQLISYRSSSHSVVSSQVQAAYRRATSPFVLPQRPYTLNPRDCSHSKKCNSVSSDDRDGHRTGAHVQSPAAGVCYIQPVSYRNPKCLVAQS